jgi:gluconolactonase
MKKLSVQALLALAIGLGVVSAQAPAPGGRSGARAGATENASAAPFRIVKTDPALDEVVAPGAKLETVVEHVGLSEGPLWMSEGNGGFLLFSDLTANRIYKRAADGELSVYLDNIYDGPDILNAGQQTLGAGNMAVIIIGSNGITLDPQGRLVICSDAARKLIRVEKDGTRTVLADRFEGKQFSGPNDVVVKSNGAAYFTDGNSGLRGGRNSPQRELPFNGFYLVKDGKVTYQGGDREPGGAGPNGIALSPDEKHLYVSAGRVVMRYDVNPDDSVGNGTVFIADMGSDGMKADLKGNLYTTGNVEGRAGVRITSPEGKTLGMIQFPVYVKEPRPRIAATNVAFGGADGKSLYMTAGSNIFRIQLKVAGPRPGPKRAS